MESKDAIFGAKAVPLGATPPLCRRDPTWHIPDVEECRRLWDRYDMLAHIREHSLAVARVAVCLALRAADKGMDVCVETVRASALLHDLAKSFTIIHGGNHAQLGGVWALEETGNPAVAQGVVHHVHWPWPVDPEAYFLPLVVLYGDKRVMHDRIVSLQERHEDLIERYGLNSPGARRGIKRSEAFGYRLEELLSLRLEMDLNASDFDCRGLV
jgi:hypothetical protein